MGSRPTERAMRQDSQPRQQARTVGRPPDHGVQRLDLARGDVAPPHLVERVLALRRGASEAREGGGERLWCRTFCATRPLPLCPCVSVSLPASRFLCRSLSLSLAISLSLTLPFALFHVCLSTCLSFLSLSFSLSLSFPPSLSFSLSLPPHSSSWCAPGCAALRSGSPRQQWPGGRSPACRPCCRAGRPPSVPGWSPAWCRVWSKPRQAGTRPLERGETAGPGCPELEALDWYDSRPASGP
eukprot:SAG22_NODE_957_length_6316_cov_2.176130_2_plen_241_part_00